jgi:hypothetical protein
VGAPAPVNWSAEEASLWSGKLQWGPGMAQVRSNGGVAARHQELYGRAPMADGGWNDPEFSVRKTRVPVPLR